MAWARYEDEILAKVRATLTTVTIGSVATAMTRFPEMPPVNEEHATAKFPMVALEVESTERVSEEWGTATVPAIRMVLALHFAAHNLNVDAHPTINAPWEYARKGSEACDYALDALGMHWGLATYVQFARWLNAERNADYSDPDQGLWVHTSRWEIVFNAE